MLILSALILVGAAVEVACYWRLSAAIKQRQVEKQAPETIAVNFLELGAPTSANRENLEARNHG